MLDAIVLVVGVWAGVGSPAVRTAVDAEPPSDREVLRALPPAPRGIPAVYECYRDDVVIVKTRLKSEPAGTVFVGGLRLVLTEGHWECSVYYTETMRAEFP